MFQHARRKLMITTFAAASLISAYSETPLSAEPPKDLDPRIEVRQSGVSLTLVAEHPDVVTPTGIDVDDDGRIWWVCSHTHFRPDDYEGPIHDEVIVLDPEGKRTVFFAQTTATMDLEIGEDGWIYLAERDRILRVKDTDGDGQGDLVEDIATLATEADYPHNGLSGLAWHPSGDLVFALGENFWKPWTLRGSDQTQITGTGEGGIFRCSATGDRLHRIARGFWNPFGVCIRSDGTMFSAENDPGARPPCRLLHVVEGGDYGFQRHYGNAPFHPFVCWDGQLTATLPMLHSLAEAPCGIAPLGNGLIVPSWTDHRIDFYPLRPDGATFQTERISLILGGNHFRPTCITQQSPTVFFLTDWVFGSYQLHGRGRVWKLEIDPNNANWLGDMELETPSEAAQLANRLRRGTHGFSNPKLYQLIRSEDRFVSLAAIDALALQVHNITSKAADALSVQDRRSLLLAIRKALPDEKNWVDYFLRQNDQEIRFETLRWISDSGLASYAEQIKAILQDNTVDYRIFEAGLATLNTLSGSPEVGVVDSEMLLTRVQDTTAPKRSRAYALRLLDPHHKNFDLDLWQSLLAIKNTEMTAEVTRALVAKGTTAAKSQLLDIARNEDLELAIRGDAIAGLAQPDAPMIASLIDLAESPKRVIREEALRSLRFTSLQDPQKERLRVIGKKHPNSIDLVNAALEPESIKSDRPEPANTEAWQKRLSAVEPPVDLDAGRRIFHHASVGTCVKCHRHLGRGSAVGPDLSAVSNIGDENRILRAILEPSRDVDPQYFPRTLLTTDGRVFTGIMLRDGGGGNEYYRDSTGRERMFKTSDIVQRKELQTSMMPEGLIDTMTDRELRNLIAFMDSRIANE